MKTLLVCIVISTLLTGCESDTAGLIPKFIERCSGPVKSTLSMGSYGNHHVEFTCELRK